MNKGPKLHPHHIRILDYTNFYFYFFSYLRTSVIKSVLFFVFLAQGRIFPMRHRDRMLSVSISFPCDFLFKFPSLRELFSPTHTHTQPAADEEVEVLSYWQLSVSSPFNVWNYIQLFLKLFHLSLCKTARNPLLMDTTCCCGGHRFVKVDTKGLRNEEKLERYPSLILTVNPFVQWKKKVQVYLIWWMIPLLFLLPRDNQQIILQYLHTDTTTLPVVQRKYLE